MKNSASIDYTHLFSVPTVAPNITAIYNTSSTSIYVKWNQPNTNDSTKILGYELLVYRNDSRSKPLLKMLVNCTYANITGLEVFTAYAIEVAAFNNVSRGPLSETAICTTDEEGKRSCQKHYEEK